MGKAVPTWDLAAAAVQATVSVELESKEEPMTPEEIRTAIDAWLDENWAVLVGKQNAYYPNYGRFFQLLSSHSYGVVPEDGAELAPDNLSAHPPYQADSWVSLGVPSTGLAFTRIDSYSGPSGDGWDVWQGVKLEGAVWMRCRSYGPEPFRACDWFNTEE